MSLSRIYGSTVAILFSWLLSTTTLATTNNHAEPPTVLVSIKPLELIAAAITRGVSTPSLLLPPSASPHSYSLRPSDVRKLTSADLVFWVGPDMETFLGKVLRRYTDAQHTIALMESQGVAVTELSSHDEHDHDNGHDHDHDHHGTHDPHIWLDPDNVIAIAHTMTEQLIAMDSHNKAIYEKNYQTFVAQIKETDSNNKKMLDSLKGRGFFVFHDAWGYLTRHYGLRVVDSFTINPAQAPGARHMASIRKQIKMHEGESCIFREPQFQPAYLDTLAADLNIKVGVLDPLASTIDATAPNAYSQYLSSLATAIYECLASASKPSAHSEDAVAVMP